ncbi:hypothetical protein JB92DRAFT_3144255 [Gautieria morchelliformis]|nr:hypothetical protein JB92DRAFT_3144255 [Gautieria morchelliformis]
MHCEIVSPTHSIRLGLARNSSVFSFKILNNTGKYFPLLASRRNVFGQYLEYKLIINTASLKEFPTPRLFYAFINHTVQYTLFCYPPNDPYCPFELSEVCEPNVSTQRSVMSELSDASEPNVEPWIEVDGQKLPKYCKEIFEKEGSIVVSCWIASQPGKVFRICGEHRNVMFISDVLINDRLVNSSVHSSSQRDMWKFEKMGLGSTYKIFEFSKVDLTDTCSTGGDLNIEEFGTIKVNYYGVKNLVKHTRLAEAIGQKSRPVMGFDPVVLRELQGPDKAWYYTCYRDGIPRYTFLFKYRSIDYLQAEGIAPPPSDVKRQESPSKASAPNDDNKDDLLIKLEYEEHHALEMLRRRQKKWQEHEEMCQKQSREREESEKKRQEREERFETERWERKEQYEKERQEREERHLEERREREERYEKERREREDRHLSERQKRQAKLEELEELYAEKAERGKRLRELRSQTSDRSRKRIKQENVIEID